MTVRTFIKRCVTPNTVIRLVVPEEGGHRPLLGDWNKIFMDEELAKEANGYGSYQFVGITDILVANEKWYPEAINLVVKIKSK